MEPITITRVVKAPIGTVWTCWVEPEHVMQRNAAADSWHCPAATNDLQVGGSFSYTMAAKDGSASFDFGGVYDEIIDYQLIRYTMSDGRKVKTTFDPQDDGVMVTVIFDPEKVNAPELQQQGRQAILDNFGKHAESC